MSFSIDHPSLNEGISTDLPADVPLYEDPSIAAPKKQDSEDTNSSHSSQQQQNSSTGKAHGAKTEEKRRSHNRALQTLHGGSKIKHLKKLDGEPLWRADIQYDFLAYIFHDTQKVFHNSYEKSDVKYTFADIYIDAMARSSKTSKILCEKLLGDRKAGLNMAMVCLLVNVGRMNTTLNFFPEMRAQLRTYHPIPSLQTYNDQSDYKQLQDSPRLKSILKGACEDRPEPTSFSALDEIQTYPKTNPINLIFLMSSFSSNLQSKVFVPPFEFHDMIMNTNLSSESRGKVFLWLMWAFLETDLRPEQMRNNPFGMGQEHGTKVPEFVSLTPEQVSLENVDPENEIEFGNDMTKERKLYIDLTQTFSPANAPSSGVPSGNLSSSKPKAKEGGRKKGGAQAISEYNPGASTPLANGEVQFSNFIPILSKLHDQAIINEKTSSDAGMEGYSLSGERKMYLQAPVAIVDPIVYKSAARDRQCEIEISKMLIIKDRENKRRRYKAGAMYREWVKIKHHDPLYDSDTEDYPEEKTGNEKSTVKGGEGKEDLAALLVHKKRKRHIPPQEAHGQAGASVSTIPDATAPIGSPTVSRSNTTSKTSAGSDSSHAGKSANNTVAGVLTSGSTIGTSATENASRKITVNNRIDYPSSFGEESLAMAKAFRCSLRFFKRSSQNRLQQEEETMKKLLQEREMRDERLKQRLHGEYSQVETTFREKRERLTHEIEMEFEMSGKEANGRRALATKTTEAAGDEENELAAGFEGDQDLSLKSKSAKKSKKKSATSNDNNEEKPKKPKAPRKKATKKTFSADDMFSKPEADAAGTSVKEQGTVFNTAQIPIEYSSAPAAEIPLFESGVISNEHVEFEHAPVGMHDHPQEVLIDDSSNIYEPSTTGLIDPLHPPVDPMSREIAAAATSVIPISSTLDQHSTNATDASEFPLIPSTTVSHQNEIPQFTEKTPSHERSNVMSLGNLLDNQEPSS